MSSIEHTPILDVIKTWRAVIHVWSKSNCTEVEKYSLCNRGIIAFKTSFFWAHKIEENFFFQQNGILIGIMKHNFSFSGLNTLLKKWNFLLLTETIANNSLCMKIIPRLDKSAKNIVNRADNCHSS